jgi:hypothetical protein
MDDKTFDKMIDIIMMPSLSDRSEALLKMRREQRAIMEYELHGPRGHPDFDYEYQTQLLEEA